jgi:hypothetical protein
MTHRSAAELESALAEFRRCPADVGTVALVVRRPAVDQLYLDLDLSEANLPPGRRSRSGRRSSR